MRDDGQVKGTHDASIGVDGARDGVDGDYMRRLLIPWAVLPPVGGRNFLPRVVEIGALLKDLHGEYLTMVG